MWAIIPNYCNPLFERGRRCVIFTSDHEMFMCWEFLWIIHGFMNIFCPRILWKEEYGLVINRFYWRYQTLVLHYTKTKVQRKGLLWWLKPACVPAAAVGWDDLRNARRPKNKDPQDYWTAATETLLLTWHIYIQWTLYVKNPDILLYTTTMCGHD